jgi:ABC-type sugar transport system substrate-binding protein
LQQQGCEYNESKNMKKNWSPWGSAAMGAAILLASQVLAAEPVKIGFVVKQPEEPWFQDEWKFAEQAGKEKGFTVVKIGAPNGEKVSTAIDSLGAQKVQGFIICTPDVKLGQGIVAKAKQYHLKLMTVDDRRWMAKAIQSKTFLTWVSPRTRLGNRSARRWLRK